MFRKFALLLLLFLVLSPSYAALSSGDAVNYVREENHYLYENEETQVIKITHAGEEYWVVGIYSDETSATFMALKTAEKKLVTSKPLNRELFKTADFIWEFTRLKKSYSGEKREWVITKNNSTFFQGLSRFLADETFDLDTIDAELGSEEATQKTSLMNSMLVSMSLKAAAISKEITDALNVESALILKPETPKRDTLGKEFGEVFDLLEELDSEAIDYRAGLAELKKIIADSGIDAQNKSFLISLAEPPQEFETIGNYRQAAVGISGNLGAAYSKVSSRIDSLLDEFDKRIKRNDAYRLLYEENDSLRERTKGIFTVLSAAAEYMLKAENKPYWNDQVRLKKLEENWRRAQKYFGEKNYELAAEYASKANDDVVAVQKGGLRSISSNELFPPEMLMQAAVLLIILLIIIYSWNKRDRIMQLLNRGNGSEAEGNE